MALHRTRTCIFALVLALGSLVPTAMPAAASTTTCSYDGGAVTVTTDTSLAEGETIQLTRTSGTEIVVAKSPGGSGGFDLIDCGEASTTNTDTIEISGSADPTSVFVVGAFTPGATPEPSGVGEIEIDVDLGTGGEAEYLLVRAGDGFPEMTAGASGIDMTGDGDVDVTVSAMTDLALVSTDQGNSLSADGGGESGAPVAIPTTIVGGDGTDVLIGGAGNDEIAGGPANDRLVGGDGDDQLGLSAILSPGEDGGNDRMDAGEGDNVLYGGSGNDRLVKSGSGADSFRGGTGIDTVSYAGMSAGVDVSLDGGPANDGIFSGVTLGSDDVDSDVEKVIGTAFGDHLAGNTVSEGPHDETLIGGGGNDTLEGFDGTDVLRGGSGADEAKGGAMSDTIAGGAGGDVAKGGSGADKIKGELGNDHLFGDAGNDSLNGGGGIDECIGGRGADKIALCEKP